VHIVMTSTEHEFQQGTAQHSFIEADLAAVNRSRTPWVILAGHRYAPALLLAVSCCWC
jgi:hypothetical protein